MSKLLLSAAALAVLLAPASLAQAPGYTLDVKIADLPASMVTNNTQMSVPFNVTIAITGASSCLGAASSGASYTVTLSAEVVDSTGNHTFANVNPRQHTIAGPVLLPAIPGASAERTEDATLVIKAGPYVGDALNTTVHVKASFSASNGGCTGTTTPAASAEKDVHGDFEPVVESYGQVTDSGQKMPGVSMGILLIGLAAFVAILRRK